VIEQQAAAILVRSPSSSRKELRTFYPGANPERGSLFGHRCRRLLQQHRNRRKLILRDLLLPAIKEVVEKMDSGREKPSLRAAAKARKPGEKKANQRHGGIPALPRVQGKIRHQQKNVKVPLGPAAGRPDYE
jgi:hypothetical protein